jgi:uncharacterized protein YjbJ (UPF0337 family)
MTSSVRAKGMKPEGMKQTKEAPMGEKTDDLKGRAKEAAGDLTDNKDLKREGQMDQAGATVKEKVGNAVDTAKDKVDDTLDDDR